MPSALGGRMLRVWEEGMCWEKYAVTWERTLLGEVVEVLQEIIVKIAKKGHDWYLSFILPYLHDALKRVVSFFIPEVALLETYGKITANSKIEMTFHT